jgi:hypothetical protein
MDMCGEKYNDLPSSMSGKDTLRREKACTKYIYTPCPVQHEKDRCAKKSLVGHVTFHLTVL